jgi:hypothetical protein
VIAKYYCEKYILQAKIYYKSISCKDSNHELLEVIFLRLLCNLGKGRKTE